MRMIAAAALLLLTAACATPSGEHKQWSRPGGTAADFQRDAFDCERETRMVAHTFTPGIFRDAEASAYAGRCMTAKGYTLTSPPVASVTPVLGPSPMSDAAGRQYKDVDKVNCRFRTVESAVLLAKTCSQGGGTILGPAS